MPIHIQKTVDDNKSTSLGNILIGVLLVLILIGFLVYLKRDSLNLKFNTNTVVSTDGSVPESELPLYTEFARKVAVSLCNLGFYNVQSYLQDNSKYFVQDILNDFQTNFFTVDLQRQIADQQLYCTAENLTAIETKIKGNMVSSWFTGNMEYTSKLTNSSVRIPFSYRLIIQKFPEGLKVVNFVFVNDQKS